MWLYRIQINNNTSPRTVLNMMPLYNHVNPKHTRGVIIFHYHEILLITREIS